MGTVYGRLHGDLLTDRILFFRHAGSQLGYDAAEFGAEDDRDSLACDGMRCDRAKPASSADAHDRTRDSRRSAEKLVNVGIAESDECWLDLRQSALSLEVSPDIPVYGPA